MKFFKNRAVAIVILVLAIAAGSFYGISRKPANLPNVKNGVWLCDDAGILSEDTEKIINSYNATWDEKYMAVVAIATVESNREWKETDYQDYADRLGKKWNLGQDDLLLLVVKDQYGYCKAGDRIWAYLENTSLRDKLNVAVNQITPGGDTNAAVVKFVRQADIAFAQNYQNIVR